MDKMEILSQSTLDALEKWRADLESSLVPQQILVVGTVVAVFLLGTVAFIVLQKLRSRVEEVKEFVKGGTPSKPRFRKRDKVIFYGNRIFRKVKSFGGNSRAKQKKLLKMANKIFARQVEKQTQLMVTEPPAEFLEETRSEDLQDQKLPKEVLYMLKSIRVFGQFETPLFLELCKHLETIKVRSGQLLFTVGDPDENVYVVQQGKLNVYITTSDGSPLSLKNVPAGESIISLLSFTDVLTGHPQPFKTVSARAVEDSTVLRLPVAAFQEVFEIYPDTFVRVIQIIMVRLQRITFTALHHYLGLGQELLRKNPSKSRGGSGTYSHLPQSPHHSTKKKDRPGKGGLESVEITLTTARDDNTLETVAHRSIMSSRSKGSIANGTPREMSPEDDSFEQQALDWFMKHLCLENDELLRGKVRVCDLPAQACLIQQDSLNDTAMFCVLSGSCYVSQRHSDTEETQLFVVHTGEVVGQLGVLSGEPSLFTIRTKLPSRIAILRKDDFYSIMAVNPKVVLHAAHSVVIRMSPFVRQIDFSLDWHTVEAGRAIYRQGDASDCFYICLSGRLRSVITQHGGKKSYVAEYGRGDLVGIVELLTRKERNTTVMAVRDTEMAKLSEGLLDLIKLKYPSVVTRLIQLLSNRILGSWQKTGPTVERPLPVSVDIRASQSNLSTIAILAISDDVPLSAFTLELYHSLTAICTTLRLTSDHIRRSIGTTTLDHANEYRLSNWIAQQEDKHRIVLYQCDQSLTQWTSRCIRQADAILIVGLADKEPSVGKIEKQLETLAVRIQKELVLLHRITDDKPKHNAVDWLNARSWCSFHHHIRCPSRMFSKKSQARIMELYNNVFEKRPEMHSDFSRLARILTGNAVGLVLGGGGARGISHIGMIKAIQEANIPIDMIGGTSIGAFMGALWAKETDEARVVETAKAWTKRMTQWWRQALDLTYPVTAMFSGRGFNKTIMDAMGENTNIEDLWLPYFTVTTDISSSCMRVHTHGSLWRYVRASMSLSGYMPPMCDPSDGHLLLDGGYVNNLPADVMRSMGARTVLAVDVGSQDESNLCNYGDYLSGWWLLWKKWNPFATTMRVPSLAEIQSRLAYVSCVRQLEEVKSSDYCEYIRPPIDRYKTLQFGSFDEIKEVGYNHGKTYFAGLSRGGKESLANIFVPYTKIKKQDFVLAGRNSDQRSSLGGSRFIDLAEVVCRVNQPVGQIDSKDYESEDDDDDEDGEDESDEDEAEYEYEEGMEGGYHSEPIFANEDDEKDETDEKEGTCDVRKRTAISLSENEL